MWTPPEAFGIVQQGIYRSNLPQPQNFGFLKTLQLKTVLVLSPERPTRNFCLFLEECGTYLVI